MGSCPVCRAKLLDTSPQCPRCRLSRPLQTPPPAAPSASPALGKESEGDPDAELERLVEGLLEPWEPAAAAEPRAAAPALELPPSPSRERLPEERARDLTDFTLQLVRAVTKSSYYTAEHQEADKAKQGLFASFTRLVADRPEVTFHAQTTGEKRSVLVYGLYDEPTPLAQVLLRDVADTYIAKLSHYLGQRALLSISFKRGLGEAEFHRFVDLLARPVSAAPGAAARMAEELARERIEHISVVAQEDRLAGRRLTWRVEMALTRLRKDLSVIPLYQHLGDEDRVRIRLQVFRDVVRPLREQHLIRELLENCDLVVEEVDEFSRDQLEEIEAQVMACVTETSIPALLQGLANDVVDARQQTEDRREKLLRLTRRVVGQVSREQAKDLEEAFRRLVESELLAPSELPPFMQEKRAIEQKADLFLKLASRILERFDQVSSASRYQKFLELFDSILLELIGRADLSGARQVMAHILAHRSATGPFVERPQMAAAWLEERFESSLPAELVHQLGRADRVRRELLLGFARLLGDGIVPALFTALREAEGEAARHALADLLAELKEAALGHLKRELAEADLSVECLPELLRLLSRIGDRDCAALAARFLQHADAAVRVEALVAGIALAGDEGESWCCDALVGPCPTLRETALKLLFERRSTAPALFAFCGRLLTHLDHADEAIARRVCTGLGQYVRGEGRGKSLALLMQAVESEAAQKTSWWSSLRGSVRGEPAHLEVQVEACRALGHLAAPEARPLLRRLTRHRSPALQQAAIHALKRIEAHPKPSPAPETDDPEA